MESITEEKQSQEQEGNMSAQQLLRILIWVKVGVLFLSILSVVVLLLI